MTIHSDWARLLREECPSAFSTHTPRQTFGVGVIDGHLQLMCLHNKLPTWDLFVKYLFIRPIMKLFDAGCPRVVLCFDCYDNVPAYKNMTQIKRAKGHKVCVFNASQRLPPSIPDDPMLYLMNRDFKKKVIDLVCERVPKMIELKPGQELIIDYKRVVQYVSETDPSKHMIPVIVPDLAPMGESDVKFARYVDKYGNALVHAIDGDYLAIALLYYSKRGLTQNNKIYIFRQLSSINKPTKKMINIKASNKRSKISESGYFTSTYDDNDREEEEDEVAGSKMKQFKKKETIPKGWVDMQLLFITIARCIKSGKGGSFLNLRSNEPYTDGDTVHATVMLMLCAGTDFSRSFYMLGPKTIWDNISFLSGSLLQSASCEVDDALFLDGVIAKLYRIVYKKHVPGIASSLAVTLGRLKRSSLSAGTKTKLPTEEQAQATIKNLKWVLDYWKMYNGSVETPLDGSNGFMMCPESHQVIFTDKVPQLKT